MALLDITNAPRSVKKSRKRLSDGSSKDYEYTTYRKQIEVAFKSESEKMMFDSKLQRVKSLIGGKVYERYSGYFDGFVYIKKMEHQTRKIAKNQNLQKSSPSLDQHSVMKLCT